MHQGLESCWHYLCPLVIAAIQGIIEAKDRTLLAENEGSINVTRSCTNSLLKVWVL